MTVDCALFLEKAVSFLNHRLSIFLSLESYSKYTPGFKVLTVVTTKNAIFWDVAPFCVEGYVLHLQSQSKPN